MEGAHDFWSGCYLYAARDNIAIGIAFHSRILDSSHQTPKVSSLVVKALPFALSRINAVRVYDRQKNYLTRQEKDEPLLPDAAGDVKVDNEDTEERQ